MGVVARLRPMRVLLAGGDRRYLRVADLLLQRSGCVTHVSEKASETPDLAGRWQPDLVVLDVTGGARAALRAAVTIDALERAPSVLLVAEGTDAERCGALPKWDALEELVARVEREELPLLNTEGAPR